MAMYDLSQHNGFARCTDLASEEIPEDGNMLFTEWFFKRGHARTHTHTKVPGEHAENVHPDGNIQ